MSWSETSPGHWERLTDGMEGFYAVAGAMSSTAPGGRGRYHHTVCGIVTISSALAETELQARLRQAWLQARHAQPHLTVYLIDTLTKAYDVPRDANSIAEWLRSSFVVAPDSVRSADELYATVSLEPLPQARLYYVPAARQLMLRAHHYVIDGIGMLQFWHAFFSAYEHPIPPPDESQLGDEPARLPPALYHILGFSPTPDPESTIYATVAAARDGLANNLPGVGPVNKLGTVPSNNCRQAELRFSAATSAALFAACHARGISVTAALHTAYIQTIRSNPFVDPAGKHDQYLTAALFDLRKYLPAPYNTSAYAAAVYFSVVPLALAPLPSTGPGSFDELACKLAHFYRAQYNDAPDGARPSIELNTHITRMIRDLFQDPQFLAKNPTMRDAIISSLGVVENQVQHQYADIEITDLRVGSDIVYGMSMLFFYTFRGTLRLQYSFNDAFEDPDHIRAYLDEMRRIVLAEMGVQE